MQESCSTVLQWPQSLFRVRQGSRLNFLKAIGASLSFLCAGISKLVSGSALAVRALLLVSHPLTLIDEARRRGRGSTNQICRTN